MTKTGMNQINNVSVYYQFYFQFSLESPKLPGVFLPAVWLDKIFETLLEQAKLL